MMRKQFTPPKLTVFGSVQFLTQGAAGSLSDAMSAMRMRMVSDINTKENIVLVDRHPLGFGLYVFSYKLEFQEDHGADRQFGVLAQEVEQIRPDAVTVGPDGFRRVDYGRLGLGQVVG
jgi:hypothetical protein